MESKSPLKSKTILSGVVISTLGFTDMLLGSGVSCEIAGTGVPAGFLLLLNGILSITLRFYTKVPVEK